LDSNARPLTCHAWPGRRPVSITSGPAARASVPCRLAPWSLVSPAGVTWVAHRSPRPFACTWTPVTTANRSGPGHRCMCKLPVKLPVKVPGSTELCGVKVCVACRLPRLLSRQEARIIRWAFTVLHVREQRLSLQCPSALLFTRIHCEKGGPSS
jgi:hypothetical protein